MELLDQLIVAVLSTYGECAEPLMDKNSSLSRTSETGTLTYTGQDEVEVIRHVALSYDNAFRFEAATQQRQ